MFRPSDDPQLDRLNALVPALAKGDDAAFGVLSTGEKCYVALASSRVDLLLAMNYTVPEALARLGNEWVKGLIYSWQYAGNPANFDG